MIIKSHEINKLNLDKNKYLLLYGVNDGAKEEAVAKLLSKLNIDNLVKFDEKEILDNEDIFYDEILSKSLFGDKKIIIVNRASNKLFKYLESIIDRDPENIHIIINSQTLEKKSKIRTLFEQSKNLVCIPFYADTTDTLSGLAFNFFREKKISISRSNINLIVQRSNGDRGILKNELTKVEFYSINKKNLSTDEILKLTNLTENHGINELIDNCLAKNQKKTLHILNENNYGNDDAIIILRTLLNKSKKILNLSKEYMKNKNINLTISSAKPPIFWKEKEITKQIIFKWTPENINNLIYKINEIELLIKKNINNSVNITTDFIIKQSL